MGATSFDCHQIILGTYDQGICVGSVLMACMEDIINAYKILVGKP